MNISELNCYNNDKGSIQMILESCQVGSISKIHCLPNTFRARHSHISDQHHVLVNYGIIHIYERPVGSEEKPTLYVLKTGDIHLTKPGIVHEMWFPEETYFDCYSLLPRNQANYELETVRVDFSLRDIYNNWKE